MTPTHCQGDNLSFNKIQANKTVTAGYKELKTAEISNLPNLVAKAKKTLPPVSKIPAKAIMGTLLNSGTPILFVSRPIPRMTRIEALLAETNGHRIALELT